MRKMPRVNPKRHRIKFLILALILIVCFGIDRMAGGIFATSLEQLIQILLPEAPMFLATFVGVVFAFELERYRERIARRERLLGALRMIRDEIHRNFLLCDQIWKELSANLDHVQYYNLKTTTWDAVSSALVDLGDPELVKQIATEYYEYDHMKRKIDARFEFFKGIAHPSTSGSFSQLSNAVMITAHNLLISSAKVRTAIDQKLVQLS
jgi:hypothetical protein